ncbi:HAD family hydrolase [Spongiactinospora sp. TRM90649]|uniref:HAD family hydrolase n=1 Tax=Spongiactinospora sp. TRM90649 TaxID=3031114 RepID=UPI0023F8B23F|nr:HAD family hydrolase [Spongiactinospora sp. TRM90649]MDF5753535.1 HAD family hydrolase [Spongiactinospora sp. TRM90649]
MTTLPTPGVAVFDLDGTIVDTPRAIVESFTAALAAFGTELPAPAEIRATIGLPLEQAVGKLLGVAADDPRTGEGVRRYQAHFREHILPRAAELLFPGARDGLTALSERGAALAVATSKHYASADALLSAAGIRDLFRVVVGADQVTHPKPHPESGHAVLTACALPAERAVMVGDTTHDLLMAKACGMRSIAVTYGVHSLPELRAAGPTWIAGTFDEVTALLTPLFR